MDFAVVLGIGDTEVRCEHSAFWRIPVPRDDDALRDHLAARLVSEELRPSNPADAPLIDVDRGSPSMDMDLIVNTIEELKGGVKLTRGRIISAGSRIPVWMFELHIYNDKRMRLGKAMVCLKAIKED